MAEFAVFVEFIIGSEVNRWKLPAMSVFNTKSEVLVKNETEKSEYLCCLVGYFHKISN